MKIETHYKRTELPKVKRFYFIVNSSPHKRGYNRLIKVYYLTKEGRPRCIGCCHADTAAYVGDLGCAVNVISKLFGYRMKDGYSLLRKDIKIFEIYQ